MLPETKGMMTINQGTPELFEKLALWLNYYVISCRALIGDLSRMKTTPLFVLTNNIQCDIHKSKQGGGFCESHSNNHQSAIA